MNLQTFQKGIKDCLGNRSTDTKLDAIINRHADILQEHLEHSGRKFDFQETERSESVSAGSSTPQIVNLPTDFLWMPHKASLRLYDSAGTLAVVLERRPIDELFSKVSSSTTSSTTPQYYDIVNGKLYIYPYLNATYTLKYFYHATAPKVSTLAATETNTWLTHAGNYFIGHVGLVVATGVIRDQVAAGIFNSIALVANKALDDAEGVKEMDDLPFEEDLI